MIGYGHTEFIYFDHPTEPGLRPIKPDVLAYILADLGLKRVGLISFISCYIGAGNFLEKFLSGCNQQNIKVGWLKGYKDFVAPAGPEDWRIVGEEEYITRVKRPDRERTKILRGNIMALPCGWSRYHY